MATVSYEMMEAKDGTRVFKLRGAIDDKADFSRLVSMAANRMVLDFDQVSAVNSLGCRAWQQMLTGLKGRTIFYEKVPSVLLAQINLVPGLKKGVTVASFYLPFSCQSCDKDADKFVTREAAQQPDFIATLNERFQCDSCTRKLVFFDDEDLLFEILK